MKGALIGAALFALTCMPAVAPFAAAANGDCGQPQSTGSGPKTADALATLKHAVGSASACDADPCICDVNADGKVNTTDALRVLRVAVGQNLTLSCDCAGQCLLLELPAAVTASGAALGAEAKQVRIEASIAAVDKDAIDALGVDLDLSALISSVAPAAGGTNAAAANLAVDSDASGGPPGLDYFLYNGHPAGSALPVLNLNFVSPFDAVKSFFLLPGPGCVDFGEGASSAPQGFPGGAPVQNLAPAGAGYSGDSLRYAFLNTMQANSLLGLIDGDSRNSVLPARAVELYAGQSVLHMIDDVEPTLAQLEEGFRNNIKAVTANPFGNFTGPTLDITPTINGSNVVLDIRIGTDLASFFFSTAFLVKGTQVDAEIPLHRRSLDAASVVVPDGTTLLLGGLLRDGTPETGLPVLGDLPLIGSMFTRKHLDAEKQKLMIFVRPTIIDSE